MSHPTNDPSSDQHLDKAHQRPIDLDDFIDRLADQQTNLSHYIDRRWDDLSVRQLARLLSTYGQAASRLGRLLRRRSALYGQIDPRFEEHLCDSAWLKYMDELPADRPQAPESTISLHPSLDIDHVITDLADKQTRLDRFLDRLWPAPDVEGIDRLFAVYSHNAARLGRLLRDRCKIYGPPLDDLSLAVDQALEEAWKHWEEFARSPD